jgi:glutamine---fructose-6-phosphate transaminase (isomerizing)
MQPETTQMFAEAGSASDAVARQYNANGALIRDLGARLRDANPQMIFTCARGSSDHAATFAKYLFETRLRIPVISQAPSISSIYGAPLLHVAGQPFILISQSGKSPDLILSAKAARAAGALVIGMINALGSPLAAECDVVIPLYAGPETSVAATKSYIASLGAIVQLVSAWGEDDALQSACVTLPDILAQAWEADWSAGVDVFAQASSMFVLGRGLTYGIAQEAALKFKETSGIHAESYSFAEVSHGPMALIKPGFPILAFPPLDAGREGAIELLAEFSARGARIATAGSLALPMAGDVHPVLAPIAMVQSFYRMVNAISVSRGLDPDHPPSLQKETHTL